MMKTIVGKLRRNQNADIVVEQLNYCDTSRDVRKTAELFLIVSAYA